MYVSFHTDPVDIETIASDLEEHGVVFIETSRTNFREIADRVEAIGPKFLPLAVKAPDGDFHNFLLHFDGNEYESGVTEGRVLKAILAWQAVGSPVPHVERA